MLSSTDKSMNYFDIIKNGFATLPKEILVSQIEEFANVETGVLPEEFESDIKKLKSSGAYFIPMQNAESVSE